MACIGRFGRCFCLGCPCRAAWFTGLADSPRLNTLAMMFGISIALAALLYYLIEARYPQMPPDNAVIWAPSRQSSFSTLRHG